VFFTKKLEPLEENNYPLYSMDASQNALLMSNEGIALSYKEARPFRRDL